MNRSSRTAVVAAASALWLVSGVAYAPVAASAPPTVKGATEEDQGPYLPDGDSVDVMPPGTDPKNERYYRLRHPDPTENVFLGVAMTVPDIGYDGLSGTTTAGTNVCSVSLGGSTGSEGRSLVAAGANAFEGCLQQGEVTVELRRFSLDRMTAAKREAPALMRVTRLPEVTNLQELPAELPKVERRSLGRGADGTATPGASISEAAPLKPGTTYKLSITSGKPQYFTVDVDWGQTLLAQTDVASSPEFDAVKDKDPTLQMDVYGPALNKVERQDHSLSGYSNSRTLITKPVVWRSYVKGGEASFLAGKHLLVLGVPEAPFGKQITFTYALTLDVTGNVTGVPKFGKQPTAAPAPTTAPVATPPTRKYAAAGLGVAGALMLIASGVLWLRAR